MSMSHILSPAEVESLLRTEEIEDSDAPAAGGLRSREKMSPYDFKRPERVGKDQMRALQTLHEGFGRNFGAAISALLRTPVEVNVASVDQLTYGEFIFSLENPTCFNFINAAPLEGQLILEINPTLLFPIINRMLGGGKNVEAPLNRPLTEIELRLVGRVTDLFLNEMGRAWETLLPLELSVDRVESNPQLVQLVPPNEVVVLIGFELRLGEVRGMINLCIPFNAIESLGPKLSLNDWVSSSRRSASDEAIPRISGRLGGAIVEVVVELAETNLSTADLIDLGVGDIIATEHDVRQPLTVSVEGRPKFHASAGAYKGRKAIQVIGPISDRSLSTEQ